MSATNAIALLGLSERMVDAARRGDWDDVCAMETERALALSGVAANDSASLPLFRALLAHTHEVRDLAAHQRQRLDNDLSQHPHRHRALSAYLHAGND